MQKIQPPTREMTLTRTRTGAELTTEPTPTRIVCTCGTTWPVNETNTINTHVILKAK
jgi:hypothetical protein